MRFFLFLFLCFVSVFQAHAWIGIIPQNGDQITIAKWTEMANMVLSGVTIGGNTVSTKLMLGTNNNQSIGIETNNIERVTVMSGGNVGIGTTTPTMPLHVNGNTQFGLGNLGNIPAAPLNLVSSAPGVLRTQLNIINTGGGGGAGSAIDFYTFDMVNPGMRISAIDNNYSADFAISTKTPGAPNNTLVERARVTANGNVGIGTTTPQTRLEINSATPNTSGLRLTQLSDTSPVSTGGVISLGVSSTGMVLPVPNGFPTILTTTATQTNASSTIYQNGNVLQIPVTPGKTYVFKAYIVYNTAALTTGIRLRMNAPNNYWYSASANFSATALQSRLLFNDTTNALVSTASFGLTNNVAILEGVISPTTAGTAIIQFASEVNGSAITIQPNSILYYYTY